jgi:nucleoside-diphosphate-sugar epimerase
MDIVVTGASGLIGMPAVRRLSQVHTVYALVRHPPAGPEMPNVAWVTCDLAHPWDSVGLPAHADVIIHLAQSRRFRDFPGAATDMFAVNVASTLHLLEYARQAGVRQFIYASSGGIYGSGPRPFAESDPPQGHDRLNFYLMTKAHAEELVNKYAAFFITTVLRPFFVYGPAQHRQMLMPRLIQSVRDGQSIRLAGPAGMRINPIYNLDFIEVLERCLRLQESCTLNVAGGEILSIRQIGEVIGAVVGKTARFIVDTEEGSDLIADIRQLERLLGYRPHVALHTGISHICQADGMC